MLRIPIKRTIFAEQDTQKTEYLKGLFAKTYLTDIKERYRIKQDAELEELMDVIASTIGGLTNPQKLENTFKTVKTYLDILEEVFLIEKSIRYDIKGKRYISTPAKYYFTDLGLRNARIDFRQLEMTHLIENLIYNELRLRGMSVDVGVVVKNEKDDNGVVFMNILEFLLDENSLQI